MNFKNKHKICFVVSSPITVNAFMMNHFLFLSKHFEIHLVANLDGKSDILSPDILSVKNIELIRHVNIFKDLKAVFQLTKYLYKENFDAVHTITPKAGLIGMISARLANVKNRIHIFTGQVWYTKKGLSRWGLMKIDSLIGALATEILVDGHSQRSFLIENKILPEKKSRVLGPGSISGVVASKFFKDLDIRNALREKYKISEADIAYVFLGRLNKDKGVLDLIEAFKIVYFKCKNIKLVFIGPDEENIESKVPLDLKPVVSFLGHTYEPYKMLQIADVFCLPSYREGFGTSILEASLLGIPVICSDTYGLMETIIDNSTGLRHGVHDIQSLANQMEKLYNSEKLRIELGKNGREYVLENFDADKISKYWVDFYKDLLVNK